VFWTTRRAEIPSDDGADWGGRWCRRPGKIRLFLSLIGCPAGGFGRVWSVGERLCGIRMLLSRLCAMSRAKVKVECHKLEAGRVQPPSMWGAVSERPLSAGHIKIHYIAPWRPLSTPHLKTPHGLDDCLMHRRRHRGKPSPALYIPSSCHVICVISLHSRNSAHRSFLNSTANLVAVGPTTFTHPILN